MGSSGSSFQKEPPYSTCFLGSSTTSVPNVRKPVAHEHFKSASRAMGLWRSRWLAYLYGRLANRDDGSIRGGERMRRRIALCIAMFFGGFVARVWPVTAGEPDAYLFTYFTKNGEDGLHLAWSADGYSWARLAGGAALLGPEVGGAKLMRDPSVTRGPDGRYHLVWTTGWNENNIGHASTRDFLTWSSQQEIPVMAHEPTVLNCWAPEVHYDDARQEYLIVWASTVPERFSETANSSGKGYNHRMYYTTTKDFTVFEPTRVFYDPGFNVIDATFLRDGGRLWMIIKDETATPHPRKLLQVAAADSYCGPFGPLSASISPAGVWAEGPTAIKIGEEYLVYFDAYREKRYRAVRSRDMKMWEDVSDKMTFPDEGTKIRMRHGTVIAVPSSLVRQLESLDEAQPLAR